MMDQSSSPSEGILVGIRMRPMNDREIAAGQEKIYKCMNAHNAVAQTRQDGHAVDGQTYYYDKVFDETTSTAHVYDAIGKEIVRGVVSGINGTIFAYGQTSSGKTHTMLGNQKDQRGVLEMAAEDIFSHICATSGRDFLLRVSFVEIYNEIIRDLLSDAADATVSIREDPKRGVYCEAQEHVISDYESIIRALKKGIAKRAVEATAMNDTSSRSHTIFKLVIESKENGSAGDADPDGAVLVSTLNLVDLAGSESVRHTGATGQRAKEGGKINQSLLSLSRVIHALSQPGAHVSFRDSKLTRLLQPSLCGNAKMSVVCCITPAEKYLEETRSTLQFASRAKLVKTNAVVNEVLDEAAALKRLRKELEELKEKQARAALAPAGISDEEQQRMEAEKTDLLGRLELLQQERNEQREQLDRLKELLVTSSTTTSILAEDRRRRKRHRDTWCPGSAGVGAPLAFPEGASFVQGRVSSAFGLPTFNPVLEDPEDGDEDNSNTSNSRSDVSSGSVAMQALSAQLAARDDQVAFLQRQLARLQAKASGKSNEDVDEDEDEDEEDGDGDTVPLEEVNLEDASAQLVEALSQLQARDEQIRTLDGNLQTLTAQVERLQREQSQGAEQDAQTEAILRGMEADQGRLIEQVEEQCLALAESESSLNEARENIALLTKQLQEAQSTTAPAAQESELEAQVGTLKDELQHAEELIAEMEADIESWRTDMAVLRSSVDESHAREESLTQAVQEADAEAAALKEQIAALEGQLEGSVGDVHEARAQAAKLSLEFNELKQAMEERCRAAEDARLQAQGALDEAQRALSAVNESEAERGTQVTAALQIVQDKSNATEAALAAAEEDRNRAQGALEEANQFLNAAKEESAQLLSQVATAELALAGSNEVLAALQSSLTTAQNEAASLQKQLFCTQKSLADSEEYGAARANEANDATSSAQILQTQLNAASATIEASDAKYAEAVALAEQREAALKEALDAAKLFAASTHAASSAQTHTVMHMHRSDTDHAALTVEGIESARREMERSVEVMRKDLGTKEAEVSRLMALAAEWQDRAQRAERTASNSLAAEQNATGGDEAQRKRIGQLQTQCDLLRSERDVAVKKVTDLEAELRSSSGRAAVAEESLMQQLQTQSARIEKLTGDCGAAQRAAEASKALENRLAEARSERDEARALAEAAANRVDELEQKCITLQQSVDSAGPGAAEAISSLKAEMRFMCERESQLKMRCEELERDGAEAQSRLRKAKEESSLMRGEWDVASDQVRSLEKARADVSSQLEEALQQVQALTEALTEAESMTLSGGLAAAANELDKARISELQAQAEAMQGELADAMQRAQDAEDTAAAAESAYTEVVRSAGEARRSLQTQLDSAFGEAKALLEGQMELQDKLSAAEGAVRSAESRLAAQVGATTTLQQEREALEIQVDSLGRQIKAAQSGNTELAQTQTRLNEALAALQDLRDEAGLKDKRIAHLETTKLTQEQLEKIKAVKEERKRLSEDNKVMKKQLQQLKKAYEELKAAAQADVESKGVASTSGASLAEVAELKLRATELSGELESVRGVSQSLKEKLRECSAQLQDYEIERTGVLAVLEAAGLDVSDLAVQDVSFEEAQGAPQRDLRDAVKQLAERPAAAQTQAQTQAFVQKQLAAAIASKEDLEQRLEETRLQHEATREEFDALVADGEDLRAKITELSEQLEVAERKAAASEDTASSEVQALEEENIELMRENRELRKEVAGLNASVDKLQTQIAKLSGNGGRPTHSSSVAAEMAQAPKSHGKENLRPSQQNTTTEIIEHVPGSDRKRPLSAVKPAATGTGTGTGTENGTPLQLQEGGVSGAKKTNKKVKPVVVAPERGTPTEEGECAQS